jgi:hypothetical protein
LLSISQGGCYYALGCAVVIYFWYVKYFTTYTQDVYCMNINTLEQPITILFKIHYYSTTLGVIASTLRDAQQCGLI